MHDIPDTQGTQVPEPSQTPPVQVVPAARCEPATHTAAPDEQSRLPLSHAFVGVQLMPETQVTQLPVGSHTPPAHGVPDGLSAPATHTGTPVAQLIAPSWHPTAGMQLIPVMHGTHAPEPLHTPPVHGVPAVALPVDVHIAPPAPHERVPVRQTSVGVQVLPSTHGTHAPAPSHAPPVHAVPLGACPFATQTGPPLAHEFAPVSHGLAGTHELPSMHATQVPVLLHTWPLPHGTPAGAMPVSLHTGAPVAHERLPTRQAAVGAHGCPAFAQSTQAPMPLQTRAVPHGVPAFAAGPVPHRCESTMHIGTGAQGSLALPHIALVVHENRHVGSQPLPVVLVVASHSSPGSTTPLPQVQCIAALHVRPGAHVAPALVHAVDASTAISAWSIASVAVASMPASRA